MGVDARRCHGDEHSSTDVLDEEPIQLRKHVDKGHPSAQVAHRLGEDSVRHEGGTNSVAGNVTDEQANVPAILRVHQREIASDGMHSVVERVDAQSEEHTSELQSRFDIVCRLLLEKKKRMNTRT